MQDPLDLQGPSIPAMTTTPQKFPNQTKDSVLPTKRNNDHHLVLRSSNTNQAGIGGFVRSRNVLRTRVRHCTPGQPH